MVALCPTAPWWEDLPRSTTRLQPFLPWQFGSPQTSGGCLLAVPGHLGASGGAGLIAPRCGSGQPPPAPHCSPPGFPRLAQH